jgi:APA family basic amino acid/polyamine antiporter
MATALVIGNMVGSGIFLLPASLGPFGGIAVFGWVFTAVGATILALVFARLGKLVPKAGGPYAFTRAGLGDFPAFLVAWGYWISAWAGNAAIATALVGYLAVFFPTLRTNAGLAALVAVGNVWILTAVNTHGIRTAGYVQLVTTVLKVLPLLVIGSIGFLFFQGDHFTPLNASGNSSFSAISATAAITLFAFLGLESATVPADQVEAPERTIPLATIIGTVITAVIYISSSVAVMGIIAPADLARSTAPYADAARSIFGTVGHYVIGAGAVIACFGALNGWILIQGQIPRAAADDGLFPRRFAKLSPQGTPVFALVVSSILITILVAMNYTGGLVEQYTFIILLATLAALVPYAFCAAAALIVGKGTARDVILASLGFLYTLWAIGGAGRDAVYWGFLMLLGGIPVYVWMKRGSTVDSR